MAKFWGLVLGCGKRYAQKVDNSFCISMAVLETGKQEESHPGSTVKLVLEHDNKQFILCILSPNKTQQLPLNVKFAKGETVALYFQGGTPSQKLHLTGYMEESTSGGRPFKGQNQSILVTTESKSTGGGGGDKVNGKEKKRVSIKDNPAAVLEPSSSDEDDEEDDMDLDDDDVNALMMNGTKKGTIAGEEDDDSDDDEDEVQVVASGRAKEVQNSLKKLSNEEDSDSSDDDDDDDDDDDSSEDDSDDDGDGDFDDDDPNLSKKSTKKEGTTGSPGTASQQARKSEPALMKTPENQNLKLKQPSSAGHTPMRMFSKGGVMCQDLKIGNGPPAKPGKMVHVYYEGRLKSNNKKFDSNTTGKGFHFKLGKGEVIKGWDLGVEGMKCGGKRKLIIPSNLGYGRRGAPPDIPPNAVLTFDVELKNVN